MSEPSHVEDKSWRHLMRGRLPRILAVATLAYFIGFIWTFTGGAIGRLFIPFQWEYFFEQRGMAEAFGGQWFLYGTSVAGLFVNWLIVLAIITAAYAAYVWIAKKK